MSAYKLVLFDDDFRAQFLPLSHTRPLADLRCGIFTVREKWERWMNSTSTTCTAEYLAAFQWNFEPDASLQNLWINARVLPSAELVNEIKTLGDGDALMKGETLIALNYGNRTERLQFHLKDHIDADIAVKRTDASCIILHRIHDIFTQNGKAILQDAELLSGITSEKLSATNRVIGDHGVHVGKNVIAEACIFNTTKGPIILGDGAEIMEGSMLRGPLSIGNGATIKMGAKIYGDTTIGPGCKVGGEVSNSVFFANSNKAHDGFIGNSVIGEWVNLGADTNCSNLKNTYGEISVFNYAIDGNENTGLQFHGVIIGDHSKCGINTMLNTGTVIGTCANVYGGGFPKKFIPDFSWGGSEGMSEHEPEKALESIKRVYARRHKELSAAEIEKIKNIFRSTATIRKNHH